MAAIVSPTVAPRVPIRFEPVSSIKAVVSSVRSSSSINIKFEKTTVKTTGNLSQLPPLDIPQVPEQFRPSSNRGRGEFEVTYLDADTRITRGDRGELRVFVIA
ncbi:hypothetical protein ACFE04_014618 [Oxalis oulophora]